MNIREYVFIANKERRDALDEEIKDEFENHVFENVWEEFIRCLPQEEDWAKDNSNSIDVWYYADADEILCRTEELADMIANILDRISGDPIAHTGYYDPEEDKKDNCVDDRTGWWYVDFD